MFGLSWEIIKKKKVMKRLETSKVKSFISFCYTFFFLFVPKNKIYMRRIKKQNLLYD